jgi:hypothetical protein
MKPGTLIPHTTSLLDQLREPMSYLHYSLSAEKSCLYWVDFLVARSVWSAAASTHKALSAAS